MADETRAERERGAAAARKALEDGSQHRVVPYFGRDLERDIAGMHMQPFVVMKRRPSDPRFQDRVDFLRSSDGPMVPITRGPSEWRVREVDRVSVYPRRVDARFLAGEKVPVSEQSDLFRASGRPDSVAQLQRFRTAVARTLGVDAAGFALGRNWRTDPTLSAAVDGVVTRFYRGQDAIYGRRSDREIADFRPDTVNGASLPLRHRVDLLEQLGIARLEDRIARDAHLADVRRQDKEREAPQGPDRRRTRDGRPAREPDPAQRPERERIEVRPAQPERPEHPAQLPAARVAPERPEPVTPRATPRVASGPEHAVTARGPATGRPLFIAPVERAARRRPLDGAPPEEHVRDLEPAAQAPAPDVSRRPEVRTADAERETAEPAAGARPTRVDLMPSFLEPATDATGRSGANRDEPSSGPAVPLSPFDVRGVDRGQEDRQPREERHERTL